VIGFPRRNFGRESRRLPKEIQKATISEVNGASHRLDHWHIKHVRHGDWDPNLLGMRLLKRIACGQAFKGYLGNWSSGHLFTVALIGAGCIRSPAFGKSLDGTSSGVVLSYGLGW